jgi:hypothetical protein
VNGPSYLLSLDVVMEWRGMVVLCQYGIEDDIAGSFVELHFVWFGAILLEGLGREIMVRVRPT